MKTQPMKVYFIYACILIVGALIAFFVMSKASKDYREALDQYSEASKTKVERQVASLEGQFRLIYQGIRTISMLPSIKNIDRHGKTIDDNANESIIQIYKNLRSNVTVSEVYIVPLSLEPEKIDPETGSFEVPILMYDDEVAAKSDKEPDTKDEVTTVEIPAEEERITTTEQAERAENVEIFEYRALKEQMAYLKENYSEQSQLSDEMSLPFLGSIRVLTCDNTDFDNSKSDPDRAGVMLSVPFYGDDGKFKGSVTAVLRDNVIRDMLPESHAAIINKNYNYEIISRNPGQAEISKQYVEKAVADPSLIFSDVVEVKVGDPRSQWLLWVGYPDSQFTESGNVRAVYQFKIFGLGFSFLVTIVGIIIYTVLRRSFLNIEANNIALERRIKERTEEIEEFAKQQEQQKIQMEVERKKTLYAMADDFENSVKDVLVKVVADSKKMQEALGGVTKIAAVTKDQTVSAVNEAAEAAGVSEHIAAAAESLTASIREISSQTQKSRNISAEAAEKAGVAKGAIENLSSQSSKVSEILSLISQIADQINLLALNATIESARAGEAGKGFAVVANEVKQLASQVNSATVSISGEIEGMQNATKVSVESVMSIIGTISEVAQSIQSVAAAVEEQTAVTNEIAVNISKASVSAGNISRSVTSIQNGAEETGRTANQALNMASELTSQSATLSEKVERFMKTVRS